MGVWCCVGYGIHNEWGMVLFGVMVFIMSRCMAFIMSGGMVLCGVWYCLGL